jgi:hypothetical protein
MSTYYRLLGLLFFVSFLACKKVDNLDDGSIKGTWEMRMATGGLAGTTDRYANGNGRTISFKNSTYIWTINDTMKNSGYYKLTRDSSKFTRKVEDLVEFEHALTMIYAVSNDSLTMSHQFNDGYTFLYVRVSEM